MSELVDLGDGLIVDADTGELIESPDGIDAHLLAARRLAEAQTQIKGWEARAGAAKAILLRQAEKTMRYDDMLVTVQQNTRKVLELDAFREFIKGDEIGRADLLELTLAAKDIDRGLLCERLGDLVRGFVREQLTKPFIVTRPVLKPAPGTK